MEALANQGEFAEGDEEEEEETLNQIASLVLESSKPVQICTYLHDTPEKTKTTMDKFVTC